MISIRTTCTSHTQNILGISIVLHDSNTEFAQIYLRFSPTIDEDGVMKPLE